MPPISTACAGARLDFDRTFGGISTDDGADVRRGDLWVTNFDAGTLVRVDPRSGVVKATIHLGHHPFGVAFGANRIWVTVS